MRRMIAPLALAVLVVVAAVAVTVAQRTDPATVTSAGTGTPAGRRVTSAGELPAEGVTAPAVQATGWLNSEPLDPAALRGKVVLYEFWTFGCINCRHVQPHVKAWHQRYAADGLVVLSIHTPEFDYEADAAAVANYVKANDIRYPVALDPNKDTWHAFANRYWPAFYLHDQQGQRRLTHFGEGSYTETEDAIRALLDVDPGSPRAEVSE